MPKTTLSVKGRLAAWLEQARPERVTEGLWSELLRGLAPVSETHLRRLIRQSGWPLDPLVEGVRQECFEALERTLLALGREYERAVAGGDRERARACRRLVILAKDHARLVLRNPRSSPEKKAQKQEMLLWLLTWLENPGVFAAWLRLRKQAAGGPGSPGGPLRRQSDI